jgi:hypothetical protein
VAVRNKIQKGASYPGLEIIAKLATVIEFEPAELLRVQSAPFAAGERLSDRDS